MSATATVGTGTTITRSGFTYKVLSFDGPNPSAEPIEASNMSTTGYKEFIAPDLIDPGEMTCEIEFDGTAPTLNAFATTTVAFSHLSKSVAGSAMITAFSPSTPLEDKKTASVTFKFSGALTWS